LSGALGGSGGGDGSFFADAMAGRWSSRCRDVGLQQVQMHIFIPALTLAALLSIDTLKTCVVLDALTRSRHDSNRELIAQGLGNRDVGRHRRHSRRRHHGSDAGEYLWRREAAASPA
jgi:hypothetical protein